jgi:hypothetical protein
VTSTGKVITLDNLPEHLRSKCAAMQPEPDQGGPLAAMEPQVIAETLEQTLGDTGGRPYPRHWSSHPVPEDRSLGPVTSWAHSIVTLTFCLPSRHQRPSHRIPKPLISINRTCGSLLA